MSVEISTDSTTSVPLLPYEKEYDSVILGVLDQMEKCKKGLLPNCDPERLRMDFITQMSSMLGSNYAPTYEYGLTQLYKVLMMPKITMSKLFTVAGGLVLSYGINTTMSMIGVVPGIGEINPMYLFIRQMLKLYPVILKIASMLSLNILDLLLNQDYIDIYEYAKSLINMMKQYRTIDPRVADMVGTASTKILSTLKTLTIEIRKYMAERARQQLKKLRDKEQTVTNTEVPPMPMPIPSAPPMPQEEYDVMIKENSKEDDVVKVDDTNTTKVDGGRGNNIYLNRGRKRTSNTRKGRIPARTRRRHRKKTYGGCGFH